MSSIVDRVIKYSTFSLGKKTAKRNYFQQLSVRLLRRRPYDTSCLSYKECGPTIVGDEWSDKELMSYLGASLVKSLGNNFLEYRTQDPPRIVLDKLEKCGYKLLSCCGIGQTCIWTLHKPESQGTTSTSANDNENQDSR